MRRRFVLLFWRLLNPLMRPLAGIAPWWVLVETVGRKTGKTRRTPLAVGRRDASGMWVVAVHGRGAGWVLNAEAAETVRYRHRLRWQTAATLVHKWDDATVATMGFYARSGLHISADNPLVLQFAPVV
jgi:deazaflavin-dependent oxidoreductase (nitroreductase family)